MFMARVCSEPILLAVIAVCFFAEFGKGQSQSAQHRSRAENEALVSLSSTLESLDCQAVIEYSGKCYRPSTIIAGCPTSRGFRDVGAGSAPLSQVPRTALNCDTGHPNPSGAEAHPC